MLAFAVAALCLFQATYAERRFQDILSPFGGGIIETPPQHVAIATAKASAARNSSSATTPSGNADDQDGEDQRGLGHPCTRDRDCVAGRGLSCIEWVCRCAPDSPVKVRIQGVDTCLPAKSLYEACRYHQECSHRSANMRCVDFLCYCPLPFELHGNGDCIEPKVVAGKIIAAVTPTTILIVIMAAFGGTFLIRKAFTNAEDKDSGAPARQGRKPEIGSPQSKVRSTSISVRMGPLKSLRPKNPTSSLYNQSHEASSLPVTRLIRVPPDKQRPNAFSPGPTSTMTAMQTSSFTPPVPFEKSSLPPHKSALSAGPPAPLSSARLIDKLLSSSVDIPDEEDISVRVIEDNSFAQHPWLLKAKQAGVPPVTSSGFQERAVLPFRKDDSSRVGDGSSLPIEWGTSGSNQERQGNETLGYQSTRHEQDRRCDDAKDDASGLTLFSSFRQSKNVTFMDCKSTEAAHAGQKLDSEKPTGELSNSIARAGYEYGMRVSSLKTETRWLYQSERPPVNQPDVPLGECQQSGRSQAQRCEEPQVPAGAKIDRTEKRTERAKQQSLTWGERNRLGVGTPFVDIEDGLLAESASIPLSFLSPTSPSFEVLPKPDISSAMLREADALLHTAQGGATADAQEKEGTSLAAEFMATVGNDKHSSNDTTLLRVRATALSGDVKDTPAVVACQETNIGSSMPPSSTEQAKAQLERAPSLPPQQIFPAAVTETASRGANPEKILKPPGDTDGGEDATAEELRQGEFKTGVEAPQPDEGTSSYSDIENLAEILTSLKVTQLGNEHLWRERTLLREYGGMAPVLPGLPAGLQWPRPAVASSPAVVLSAGTPLTMPSAELTVPPSRKRTAIPASALSSAGPSKVAATAMLPPLQESSEDTAELPPSGEGSDKYLTSKFRTPAELQSQSTQEEDRREWENTCVTSQALSERRQSTAELHGAPTTTTHQASPATSSSTHPVPFKRSIRFRRTSESTLQAISEAFHGPQTRPSPTPLPRRTPTQGEGERIGNVSATKAVTKAPPFLEEERASCTKKAENPSSRPEAQAHVRAANVRSEPLRGRSPFVVRKNFSEPINRKELEVAASKASRKRSRSSTSAFQSSDLGSMNTGSSSVVGYDNAYDTDALIPGSIPAVTTTSADEQDGLFYDTTLSPSLYGSRLLPESALMPTPERSSVTASATTDDAILLSAMASSTPQPCSFGNASLVVSPPTPRRGQERGTSVVTGRVLPQQSKSPPSYSDFGTTSSIPRPVPLPRKIKNILSSSIGSVTRATWGTAAPVRETAADTAEASAVTSATPIRRSTVDGGSRISKVSQHTKKPFSRLSGSSKREKRSTTTSSRFPSHAARGTPLGQDTGSTTSSKVRTTLLFSPSTSFPTPPTDTLASCGLHRRGTYASRKHGLLTSNGQGGTAIATTTATTTSTLGASSSKRKSKLARKTTAAATRKKSSLPRFFFGRHRESEGGDDASSVPSESSGTTDGLRLSAIMAKMGILPSHRFFASSTTNTGLSLETVLPSRHGAGDRGGHSGNDDTTSRALFTQSEASSRLPRVWPESSTSFSVAETSEPDSFLVDDSCADVNTAASERGTSLPLQARRGGRERSASLRSTAICDAFRGLITSPDPEWYSCSSRISDRPARPF